MMSSSMRPPFAVPRLVLLSFLATLTITLISTTSPLLSVSAASCASWTFVSNASASYCTLNGLPTGNSCSQSTNCICTTVCDTGFVLTGLYQQQCLSSGSWTGGGPTNILCTDERTIASAGSICELHPTSESCSVCSTLLYEPFNWNVLNTGRWTVTDTWNLGTTGPSVWGWTNTGGITSMNQTKTTLACASGAALCTTTALVYQQGSAFYNYKVRLRYLWPSTGQTSSWMALAFNMQDYNNTYELVLTAATSSVITLRKKVAGVYTNAWSSSPSVTRAANVWQNLEVEARFGKIRVWNDGVLVSQPYFDTTYTSGTIGILMGNAIQNPRFDSIIVQQMALQNSLPAQVRVNTAALGSHTFYANGVAYNWAQSPTIPASTSLSPNTVGAGEWTIPYNSKAIAITSNSGTLISGAIEMRALWIGVESGNGSTNGWWCAPGFDSTWIAIGYQPDPAINTGSPFLPALTQTSRFWANMYYGSAQTIDKYPYSIWTTGASDPIVTCLLTSLPFKATEPYPQQLLLNAFSFLPGGFPFYADSWLRVDPVGYSSYASIWNAGGTPSNPGGTLALSGFTPELSMDSTTRAIAADLSGQGSFQVYKFGWNYVNYNFTTYMATTTTERVGIVWAYRDLNNYYEYVQSYESVPGYHCLRKRVGGFSTTVFITGYSGLRNTVYSKVQVVSTTAGYSLYLNDVLLWNDVWDILLNSGTMGFQGYGGTSYWHSTSLNFFTPTAGGSGNVGIWTSINAYSISTTGKVTESSVGGLTFFRHNHWAESWANTHLSTSSSTQISGWTASVFVALSSASFPSTAGSMGLAFYWQSISNYYEIVLSTDTTTVSINKRGTNGALTSTLCSGTVTVSSPVTQSRKLTIMSKSGSLRAYIDGTFVCSATDPNANVALASFGEVLLLSDQRAGAVTSSSIFTSLRFEWIPTTSQDTGMCGTATCTCANGATCAMGVAWATSTCTCTSAWSGSTCTTPKLTYTQTQVTGNGLTGGSVNSTVYVNFTAYYNGAVTTNLDSYYASQFLVQVTFTNVFGFVAAVVTPQVNWLGAGSSQFWSSYVVAYTGNVSVSVTFLGNALGSSGGTYNYSVPTGTASAGSFKTTGSGITGTTISTLSYINLIAQDSSQNEVKGSTSAASQIVVIVQQASGAPLNIPVTYTGVGGRYSGSYTPTVSGSATVTITSAAVAINGSPFSLSIKAAPTLPVILPSNPQFKFKWSPTSITSDQIFQRYDLMVSTDSSFSNVISSAFTAAPASYLQFKLPLNVTYYFKVNVRVQDAFTGSILKIDLSASDYQYVNS